MPVPLAPRRIHQARGQAFRLLAAGILLGAILWPAAGIVLQMRTAQADTAADCTDLVLDRETGLTHADACAGAGPRLPNTLTALLPGSLPDHIAATR